MLSISKISDIAREAQIAFCLNKYPSFEVAFARLIEAAALATRGPIGAVEPEDVEGNLLYEVRLDAERWRRLPAWIEEFQIDYVGLIRAIDADILALSRTPGEQAND